MADEGQVLVNVYDEAICDRHVARPPYASMSIYVTYKLLRLLLPRKWLDDDVAQLSTHLLMVGGACHVVFRFECAPAYRHCPFTGLAMNLPHGTQMRHAAEEGKLDYYVFSPFVHHQAVHGVPSLHRMLTPPSPAFKWRVTCADTYLCNLPSSRLDI
jgi:hypothetical protein